MGPIADFFEIFSSDIYLQPVRLATNIWHGCYAHSFVEQQKLSRSSSLKHSVSFFIGGWAPDGSYKHTLLKNNTWWLPCRFHLTKLITEILEFKMQRWLLFTLCLWTRMTVDFMHSCYTSYCWNWTTDVFFRMESFCLYQISYESLAGGKTLHNL